jgi:hypothetical protein
MSVHATRIDTLRKLAEKSLNGSIGEGQLERGLSQCTDASGLRDLAYELTPHPEVSVPIYRRLIELSPADANLAAELGFIFWLCGEDELARDQADRGSQLDPDNVQTLLLRAALTSKRGEKRLLYRKVLEHEPENRVALANLEELSRADETDAK